jgi:hypothetical protein
MRCQATAPAYTEPMRAFTVLLCVPALLLAESAAGLKWATPTGWKMNEGSRPMRAATYSVPAAAGDPENAECVVYFFGAGQGGSIEANLDRWKNQFLQNGQPANAQIGKRTAHGLPVTTIESAGDYTGMGGPTAKEATFNTATAFWAPSSRARAETSSSSSPDPPRPSPPINASSTSWWRRLPKSSRPKSSLPTRTRMAHLQ